MAPYDCHRFLVMTKVLKSFQSHLVGDGEIAFVHATHQVPVEAKPLRNGDAILRYEVASSFE